MPDRGATGYPESDAARLCWSIVYLTLGLTQEQQTPTDKPRDHVHKLFDSGAYPALAKVGERLMIADTFDARFDYGIAGSCTSPESWVGARRRKRLASYYEV